MTPKIEMQRWSSNEEGHMKLDPNGEFVLLTDALCNGTNRVEAEREACAVLLVLNAESSEEMAKECATPLGRDTMLKIGHLQRALAEDIRKRGTP